MLLGFGYDGSRRLALDRFCLGVLIFWLLGLSVEAGPLSERVVFVADKNGLKKLYICRPDGRDLKRFSREPGDQLQPRYSAVLERLFYVRREKKHWQVCSLNHQGEDLRIEVAMLADAVYPDVSPDGKVLIFSTDLWGAYELATLDLTTREVKRLTYDQGINTYPRFSPDGKTVMFLSRRTGRSEIYTMRLADKALTQLTDSAFPTGVGSWSPEGSRIVCTEARPPKLDPVLVEMELATGNKRYLLPKIKGVRYPSYSVDGSQILYLQQDILYTYDPSDTTAQTFPIRGQLSPEDALWIPYPLP